MQVKDLLEAGHTLHAPLCATAIAKTARFVHSTGMLRYNYFLLPIFTFVRKCCGVSQADLDAALEKHHLLSLVYAPPDAPPRAVTPLTPQTRPSTVKRPVRKQTRPTPCYSLVALCLLRSVHACMRRC